MPVLKFLCPTTRSYFDSGIRLDETSAAVSRLKIVRVRCVECRREHRFLLADGVLDPPDALIKRRVPKGSAAKKAAPLRDKPRIRRRGLGAPPAPEKHLSSCSNRSGLSACVPRG
jgi:hypothetical protein